MFTVAFFAAWVSLAILLIVPRRRTQVLALVVSAGWIAVLASTGGAP